MEFQQVKMKPEIMTADLKSHNVRLTPSLGWFGLACRFFTLGYTLAWAKLHSGLILVGFNKDL